MLFSEPLISVNLGIFWMKFNSVKRLLLIFSFYSLWQSLKTGDISLMLLSLRFSDFMDFIQFKWSLKLIKDELLMFISVILMSFFYMLVLEMILRCYFILSVFKLLLSDSSMSMIK